MKSLPPALLLAWLAGAPMAATYDCVMDPAVVVEVGAPVTGLLDAVLVSRGQVVAQGDVIARLKSDIDEVSIRLIRMQADNRDEVAMHQARLDLALKRQARLTQLSERGVATQEQLDEADAAVDVAGRELGIARTRVQLMAVELEQAEALRAQKEIRSPIDGIVVERNLAGGEFMTQESHIATIAQLDPLHVEAFLPVSMYPALSLDQVIEVSPGAPIGGVYPARITAIDRVFDAASGTFGIRLALPNPGSVLPAGHRCTLEIPGDGG
ncbi:efflux RND transporter periplasmic adaptor subunit [Thetidibacter halocola]|uniref:Efflux RND transporter periplasmic adaptor subunit n=1 Tax=Thetidibacter halocola TaxID=2827239 RepID=A0A8J8BAE6_9RHOB|nr:efflux RND transporter periplasmic adaptor subunit [Thetidibacter halocola]MBS0126829.1 efflux RND transporter periplasmic adaptor subunit [Thetidibacter halocola]